MPVLTPPAKPYLRLYLIKSDSDTESTESYLEAILKYNVLKRDAKSAWLYEEVYYTLHDYINLEPNQENLLMHT